MNLFTELRSAFYITALTFIWLMLEYLVGLHDKYIEYHSVVTMFAILIPVVFAYLGMKRKRDVDYDGLVTFGLMFRTGIIITIFTALMMIPLQFAFHYLINPAFFDNMIHHSVEHAIANEQNPQKAFEDARAYFNIRSYVMQTVVGTLILGTILSVIYSFILSRKKVSTPPPTETIPPTPAP